MHPASHLEPNGELNPAFKNKEKQQQEKDKENDVIDYPDEALHSAKIGKNMAPLTGLN
jgi:hypothetical protein